MNTALRNALGAALMGWMGLGMLANAEEAGAEPQFCVGVYTYTSVSPSILNDAEKTAHEIFARAGVETTWTNYVQTTPADHLHLSGNNECASTMPRVLINLIGHSKSGFPGEFLGVAPGDPKEGGRYIAYLFIDMADKLALRESGLVLQNCDGSESIILAHAMAHEIGHLMMLEHSATGVMRPFWYEGDFTAMAQGRLNFNRGQAARLGKEVILRAEDLDTYQPAAIHTRNFSSARGD